MSHLSKQTAGLQSTNIKAGLLTIMAVIAFIFGVSSIISPYQSAHAYTYWYCYNDQYNDAYCFYGKAECEQQAQQAGLDKSECGTAHYHFKYTATWEVYPGLFQTFSFEDKRECEQAAQEHGVECTRIQ
jgi:hypothetical protein